MTKVLFIVNPIAGGGRALRGWRVLRPQLPPGAAFNHVQTRSPGEGVRLAARAVTEQYDAVVPVGGDGTIQEVVNGLLSAGLVNSRYTGPVMGLLPLGRGNDFARTFEVGGKLKDLWMKQWWALTGHAAERRVDVGRLTTVAGSSYFINMCGAGFDADVAATANRLPRRLGGALPYLAGIFLRFIALSSRLLQIHMSDVVPVEGCEPRRWRTMVTARTDDGREDITVRQRFLLVLAGVGRFLGGGMMLLPHAEPRDGYLDVMLAGPVSRLRLLRVLRSSFTGRHILEPEVAYFRARRLSVRGTADTNIHADGDYVGTGSVEIDALPRVLPVLF